MINQNNLTSIHKDDSGYSFAKIKVANYEDLASLKYSLLKGIVSIASHVEDNPKDSKDRISAIAYIASIVSDLEYENLNEFAELDELLKD